MSEKAKPESTGREGPAAPSATQTAEQHIQEERVRRVELLISTLLRTGVIVSLVVILAGTLLSFVHHPEYLSSRTALAPLIEPGATFPHTVSGVLAGLTDFRGQSVVTVGLLILIATPVVRVAVSALAFVYQRDRIYVAITSVVLALLLLSFVLGKVE
jgi:uncharacterized membrane protein